MRTSRILGFVAFTLMALFGLLGGLFAAGYAVDDPGGWAAALMIIGWVVPVAVLAVVALKWPSVAVPILAALAVVAVLGETLSWFRIDAPISAVSTLGLGVAMAFLGLRRPTSAGLLMVGMALAVLAVLALTRGRGQGEGPGLGAILGGSSGAVVLPVLVVGLLFLVAGLVGHHGARAESPVLPDDQPARLTPAAHA